MRVVSALGFITFLFILGYWAAVFAGAFPVEELVPGYRTWFMAFPLADGWIGLWAGLAAVAGWRREERTTRYALLAGSGLVFLGLYAATYGVSTGLVWRRSADEYIEIGIKAYCLIVGVSFTLWGLRRAPSLPGSGELGRLASQR